MNILVLFAIAFVFLILYAFAEFAKDSDFSYEHEPACFAMCFLSGVFRLIAQTFYIAAVVKCVICIINNFF